MKSIQLIWIISIGALAILDGLVWTIGTKRFLKANNAKLSVSVLQDFLNTRRLAREQALSPWFLWLHVAIWLAAAALLLASVAIGINLK